MIVSTIFISILLSTASSETLLQEAQTNLIQEQWEEAATILDELAVSANASPEVMYDRGIAHYNLGQFDIASIAFEDAMSTSENQKLRTHSARPARRRSEKNLAGLAVPAIAWTFLSANWDRDRLSPVVKCTASLMVARI